MPKKTKTTLRAVGATPQQTLGIAGLHEDATGSVGENVPTLERPSPAAVHAVIDAFHERYTAAYGVAPTIPARQLPALKKLVTASGQAEALRRLAVLFDGHGPRWLRPPFDLSTFVQHFDKLVIAGGRAKPSDLLRGGS